MNVNEKFNALKQKAVEAKDKAKQKVTAFKEEHPEIYNGIKTAGIFLGGVLVATAHFVSKAQRDAMENIVMEPEEIFSVSELGEEEHKAWDELHKDHLDKIVEAVTAMGGVHEDEVFTIEYDKEKGATHVSLLTD